MLNDMFEGKEFGVDFLKDKFEDHLKVLGNVGVEEEIEATDVPEIHEVEKQPGERGHLESEKNELND